MIRLCLHGASGRMGGQVLRVLPEFSDFSLTAALVGPQSARLNQEALPGVSYTCDLHSALKKCDVVVDFSSVEASLRLAQVCAEAGKPLLIGTTGHSQPQLETLKQAAAGIAVLMAANTSPGVFVLQKLCRMAAAMLGDGYDIEILELHHRAKKDAPSGTALGLAQAVRAERDLELSVERASRCQPRSVSELGLASLRGGDVCGEHSVFFLGSGERLELSHRVSDRAIFARGALRLARELLGKTAGFYSMGDVLNTPN